MDSMEINSFLSHMPKGGARFIGEAALRRLTVVSNEHAPGAFRALTVRNLDAWYSAFDVKPGQKLYLAPQDRVRIW